MTQLLWTQKQDIGPTPRSFAPMAWDAANGQVVLFGGLSADNSTFLNDTWGWDGESWTQLDDIGPSQRARHGLVFDAKRMRIVLFAGIGGSNSSFTPLRDTWEWDGDAWTQIADTGPSPRSGHAMVYDTARGRVLLFGGNDNGGALADTWSWDGVEWTQEQDDGPPARTAHAMAYDSVRDRVVLFGGESFSSQQVTQTVSDGGISGAFGGTHTETHTVVTTNLLNDTWEFDGTLWTRAADTGPDPRAGAGMIYNGQSQILFGGRQDARFFNDTWEWDGAHWTQRQDIGPPARAFAGMAFDANRDRAVLFGGAAGTAAFGDTWEEFTRKPAPPPA